jgi:hypothetical protein
MVYGLALLAACACWATAAQATADMGGRPSLGFNNCNIECCNATMPNAVFVRKTADLFVALGLKDAGYLYVNMCVAARRPPSLRGGLLSHGRCCPRCLRDDCWELAERVANGSGHQQPDPSKFPDGIKNVTDYVHGLGLKFGLCIRPLPLPLSLSLSRTRTPSPSFGSSAWTVWRLLSATGTRRRRTRPAAGRPAAAASRRSTQPRTPRGAWTT